MLERFEWTESGIARSVIIAGHHTVQEIRVERSEMAAVDAWDGALLRGAVPSTTSGGRRGKIRVVDVFSGAGGLSWGVLQGLKAVGYSPVVELAGDLDASALALYDRNIGPAELFHGDVSRLVTAPIDGSAESARFAHAPWVRDRRLAARLAGTDVLIGGPPCQGHSSLNNWTRHFDPRNELYLAMPTIAVALDIPIVIIENVRQVRADRHQVVDQTVALLTSGGYGVAVGVMSALDLGVPQTRSRYFIVGVKGATEHRPLGDLIVPLQRSHRSIRWAIGDLENSELTGTHSAARLSVENMRRIGYLFDNDIYDLPDGQRPDCHKNGHTYRAVYGRLHWDRPAQTITTGFLTPGRGRYVHPSQRRTLTPREAARIQGFPDSYHFAYPDGTLPSNKILAKVIGDAVPPQMGEAAIFAAMQMRSTATGAVEAAA